MKNSKFNSLLESVYGRYSNGAGFLVGDVVKLKSNYESTESYKKLGENVKERIKEIIATGNNIRIGKLHNTDTASRYSAEGAGFSPAQMADCYEEVAPSFWRNLITIPVECLEEVNVGNNLPPVPEGQKDTEERVSGPEEFGKHKWHKGKAVNDQNKLGKKQNWVEKGDYKLAEKDTKLAHSNKYDDAKPSKVKGLEKAKELKESIEDLYIKILNEDVNVEYAEVPDSDSGPVINGKTVNAGTIELDGVELDDPYYSNAYVASAEFTDGTPLSPEEIEELNQNRELITSIADQHSSDVENDTDSEEPHSDQGVGIEDEGGNALTGALHNSKKGDEIEVGGKKMINTTGTIAEEVCPICGKQVCECENMPQAPTAKVYESPLKGAKAPNKPFLPGGNPETVEIKASKHSHHGS